MRFLGKFSDPVRGIQFSKYLTTQGVENTIDRVTNSDWGSDEYGNISTSVWIIEEDKLEKAQTLLQEFQDNPEGSQFIEQQTAPPPNSAPKARAKITPIPTPASKSLERDQIGTITLYLIVLCSLLFVFVQFNAPQPTKITEGLPYLPVLSSPLKKELLFDYPTAYTYIDKIVALYGIDKYATVQQLPAEGKALFQKYDKTPIWQGLYTSAINYFNPPKEASPEGSLFEKIREGEVWRTFTPALLHADIFHLIFNMIWLALLGKQMELRLSKLQFIIFIIVAGVFSNFSQYLMSGANFIGFSGILCGMLTFIWIRQKNAAWEGYHLQPGTFSFMMFFICTMVAIQAGSFVLEAANITKLSVNIANTAHLSGGLIGVFLGKLSFFEWKSKVK